MNRRDELRALAERVEALTGPCREVDALVTAEVRTALPKGCDWALKFPKWEGWRDGKVRVIGNINGNGDYIAAQFTSPTFTASLNAAMTLAGDNFGSLMKGRYPNGKVGFVAVVSGQEATAPTPALAVCAAALLALSEQEP